MQAVINKVMPSASNAHLFAVLSLSGIFIWFGLMNLAGSTDGSIARWVDVHPFANQLKPHKANIALGLGIIQTAAGLLIAIYSIPQRFKRMSYGLIALLALGSLSLLFTNPVWMKSVGGFPAIGTGQGLIKYIVILGVALWFLNVKGAREVMLIGLIIVLGWIGAMKFTGPEADGVWPLLTSSPVFNWWITDFGKQTSSNIIGGIELLTVLLLTAHWWNRRAYEVGLVLAGSTFIVTLSFLFTFSASWTGGFPNLASTGHFLMKDAILLAAVFILYRD